MAMRGDMREGTKNREKDLLLHWVFWVYWRLPLSCGLPYSGIWWNTMVQRLIWKPAILKQRLRRLKSCKITATPRIWFWKQIPVCQKPDRIQKFLKRPWLCMMRFRLPWCSGMPEGMYLPAGIMAVWGRRGVLTGDMTFVKSWGITRTVRSCCWNMPMKQVKKITKMAISMRQKNSFCL